MEKKTYKNDSYQDRALGCKFYNDGYIDKIYLSSGREQKIPETLLIKSFLVDQGYLKKKFIYKKNIPIHHLKIFYMYIVS